MIKENPNVSSEAWSDYLNGAKLPTSSKATPKAARKVDPKINPKANTGVSSEALSDYMIGRR